VHISTAGNVTPEQVKCDQMTDLEMWRSSTWHSNNSLSIFRFSSSSCSTTWNSSVTSFRWISVYRQSTAQY